MRAKKVIPLILSVCIIFGMVTSVFSATTDPTQSQREKDNAALARKVAAQGMVLLEQNDENVLPIEGKEKPIALFGNGAVRTVRGGSGSGDPFNGGLNGGGDPLVNQSDRYHVNIFDTFVREGYTVTNKEYLENWAVDYDKALVEAGSLVMSTFMYPEMELTQELLDASAEDTDMAIYVISRNAGEGSDRSKSTVTATLNGVRFEVGDYELTDVEKANLALVGKTFDKVAVVLNVGGNIDTKFFDEIEGLDSLLLMGQAGQESGDALFDVVTGVVTPSGKLTSTWAVDYDDYPASETFANHDGNTAKETYEEGIYVGYRYFDTFGIAPKYAFGYGLSYTDFDIAVNSVEADQNQVTVSATVTNTGDTYSGKEVVQVYYSAPDSAQAEKAYQELIAFAKTDDLAPGQSQTLTISYNTADMAYYNEAQASYMLDAGDYIIRVGNSSRNTEVSAVLKLDQPTVTEILSTQMHLPEEENLTEWSKAGQTPYTYTEEADEIAKAPVINLHSAEFPEAPNNASPYDDETVNTYTTDPDYVATQDYENVVLVDAIEDVKLLDVYNGLDLESFVAQMTLEELALLNCGSGWGVANENDPIVGSNSDTIPGAAGETTIAFFDSYGIPAIVVADGPGGIRILQEYTATDVTTGEQETYYQYCTAWPVSVLRAQTWDLDLLYEVGKAYAAEAEEMGITLILGPSLNIHRDPLCGRNFEYYSEDPIVSGFMAASITLGIQSVPGVGADLKHYAANNQETNRNSVDTIVSERTLREIYLKGFEIAVKASMPMSVMTSYNLINGVPTADDYDLNTDLLRGEWGLDGLVMTDWNGGSSTPALSMHAGNDLIMPGGESRVKNIIGGVIDLEPNFDENGQVTLIDVPLFGTWTYLDADWGEFTVSATGTKRTTAELGEEYTASVTDDGQILVNGEVIYRTYRANMWGQGTFTDPLTTQYAEISEDGKQIIYYGDYPDNNVITLGDVQKSAINNLKIILESIAMREFYGEDTIDLVPYSSQYDLVSYTTVTKSPVGTYHSITVDADDSVTVTLNTEKAIAGETVSFTVDVEDDTKVLDRVTIYNEDESDARALIAKDGVYSFEMIDENVIIRVTLKDVQAPDTNHLEYIISIADNYIANGEVDNITASAQKEFHNAYNEAKDILEKAKMTPPQASQTEVNEAAANLLSTFKYLELKVDKEMLRTLIALAESMLADSDSYIPNSISGLRAVVNEAKAVEANGDATNKQINQVVIKLIDEIDKARLRPDKSALSSIIKQMQALDSKLYTVDSFAVLTKAVNEGVDTLEDDNADADGVNGAVAAIQEAYAGLVKVSSNSGSGSGSGNTGNGNGSSGSSNGNSSNGSGGSKTTGAGSSPKTGDSLPVLAVVLLGAGIAAIMAVKKHKSRK